MRAYFALDPAKKVVGLVHAGWQGTLKQAAASAISMMQSQYGTNPAEIVAGIGPSIAADHYPVGEEVISRVKQVFGSEADHFITGDSQVGLDLWRANQFVLEQSGVKQIEVAGICTACNLGEWYSHRAECGRTGRFGVLIGLPE